MRRQLRKCDRSMDSGPTHLLKAVVAELDEVELDEGLEPAMRPASCHAGGRLDLQSFLIGPDVRQRSL